MPESTRDKVLVYPLSYFIAISIVCPLVVRYATSVPGTIASKIVHHTRITIFFEDGVDRCVDFRGVGPIVARYFVASI